MRSAAALSASLLPLALAKTLVHFDSAKFPSDISSSYLWPSSDGRSAMAMAECDYQQPSKTADKVWIAGCGGLWTSGWDIQLVDDSWVDLRDMTAIQRGTWIYGPEGAHDGNYNSDPDSGSCSHTSQKGQLATGIPAWWEIDLGKMHSISEVAFQNVAGDPQWSNRNYMMDVYVDDFLCHHHYSTVPHGALMNWTCNARGRKVRVQRRVWDTQPLYFCELGILGQPLTIAPGHKNYSVQATIEPTSDGPVFTYRKYRVAYHNQSFFLQVPEKGINASSYVKVANGLHRILLEVDETSEWVWKIRLTVDEEAPLEIETSGFDFVSPFLSDIGNALRLDSFSGYVKEIGVYDSEPEDRSKRCVKIPASLARELDAVEAKDCAA